jgi:hypothetical protein
VSHPRQIFATQVSAAHPVDWMERRSFFPGLDPVSHAIHFGPSGNSLRLEA